MTKKCDTEKYRRRRAREKIAHAKHVARRQREAREYRAIVEAENERCRLEWLADPRRQQIQELVNVLCVKLYASPDYHVITFWRSIERAINGQD